jgi:hypothetical protein
MVSNYVFSSLYCYMFSGYEKRGRLSSKYASAYEIYNTRLHMKFMGYFIICVQEMEICNSTGEYALQQSLNQVEYLFSTVTN